MIKTNAILYHPLLAPRFSDYGIAVPLASDRSKKVWNELKKEDFELKEVSIEDLPLLSWQDMTLGHDLDYIARLLDDKLALVEIESCYEFESEMLIKGQLAITKMPEDVLLQCRGTLKACEIALKEGVSFFLGGGMHHAMSFSGRGFCLLNDLVICARKLQRDHGLKKILIIDVDVHKGDGSAQMTEHDETISTLSIHMAKGWPLDGSLGDGPWNIPSTLDIAIERGEEAYYLERLNIGLSKINLSHFDFALVVLGADPWEHDELASSIGINLSLSQMLERDVLIEKKLQEANIPHTYTMGGGYGVRAHEPYLHFLKHLLD